MRKKYFKFNFRLGTTLLELIVAVGIVGIMLVAFASTLFGVRLLNEAKKRYIATTIAEAGLDGLRAIDSDLIADQTNEPFLGVLVNSGVWEVTSESGAPSAPKVLKEIRSSPPGADISGLLILTPRLVSDATVEAKIKFISEAGATTAPAMGLAVRARDVLSGYFFSLDDTSIQLEKRNAGINTTLFSQARAVNEDTWYTLKIIMLLDTFLLYVDGNLVSTVVDSTFQNGEIAVFGEYARLTLDDISLTGDVSAFWDFNANSERSLPDDLKRTGFGDLPEGRGTLTIENAYSGNDALKKATIKVYWAGTSEEKNIEAETLIKK